jgi:hypothetical protein
MKMSGSIRQTKTGVRRLVSRQSPPRFALPEGTACRVPDAHQSEPGFFFPVEPATAFCPVPKSAPSQRALTSYCIPLERKSRLGARSDFHE